MHRKLSVLFKVGAFLVCFCTTLLSKAQNSPVDSREMFPSMKLNFKLPATVSDRNFSRYIRGIVDADLGYFLPFNGNALTIGGGLKYNHLTVNDIKLPELERTNIDFFGGYLYAGYENFVSETILMDIGFKGGYTAMRFKNDTCLKVLGKYYTEQTPFAEPHVAFHFVTDENLAFSITASYVFFMKGFEPDRMCVDLYEPVHDVNWGSTMQLLNFGFGISLYFGEFKDRYGVR